MVILKTTIMKIGIIGSGNIGGTLGRHWAKAGHEVMFSSRNPDELKEMADSVGAKAGTPMEAADHAEVILLAIPLKANETVANELGDLNGKILIDATNPYPGRDGDVAKKIIEDDKLTSTGWTASLFPGARVVKAFNSVYFKVLEERAFRNGKERVAVQLASDDESARQKVKQLIEDIGMAPQDMGSLEDSKSFEPDAPLYNRNFSIEEAENFVKNMM